jgi:hypothetical protein
VGVDDVLKGKNDEGRRENVWMSDKLEASRVTGLNHEVRRVADNNDARLPFYCLNCILRLLYLLLLPILFYRIVFLYKSTFKYE